MKLEQIKMKLAKMLLQMGTIKTDKAILEYDGEELAVGVALYVVDENGERIVAEDGEYVTEEEKTIVVADGKVAEIKEKEEEKPAEEEEEKPTEELEAEEEEKAEETPAEETIDEIAKIKEDIAKINEILNEILDKIGKNADEVEARLSKVEKMSASKTIEVEFEAIKGSKTNAKIDTKMKRVEEMSKNWRNI